MSNQSNRETNIERNIEAILTDWIDALRRSDLDAVERRLDPAVVWQGVSEDLVCPDRGAVLATLSAWQRVELGVTAFELIGTEDRVILGVRSEHLQEIGDVPLGGQIFNVFTLREGRIVRIDDYARRGEALSAAGVEGWGDWR